MINRGGAYSGCPTVIWTFSEPAEASEREGGQRPKKEDDHGHDRTHHSRPRQIGDRFSTSSRWPSARRSRCGSRQKPSSIVNPSSTGTTGCFATSALRRTMSARRSRYRRRRSVDAPRVFSSERRAADPRRPPRSDGGPDRPPRYLNEFRKRLVPWAFPQTGPPQEPAIFLGIARPSPTIVTPAKPGPVKIGNLTSDKAWWKNHRWVSAFAGMQERMLILVTPRG